jgi:hypothetical protein
LIDALNNPVGEEPCCDNPDWDKKEDVKWMRRRSGMELAAERWTGAHEWMQKFDSDEPDHHYWKGIKTAALTQFKDFSGIQDNEEALDRLLEIAGVEKKDGDTCGN